MTPEAMGGRGRTRRGAGGEDHLQLVYAQLQGVAFAVDRDLRLLVFNDAFASIVRELAGEDPTVGADALELLKPADRPEWRRRFEAALAGELERFEQVLSGPTGARMHVSGTVGPLRRRGAVVGASVHQIDVTALREREEALDAARARERCAAAATSAFLGSISHELRTPLNGLLGTLALLEGRTCEPEDAPLVEDLRISADRLATLVERVIELTRLEGADVDLELDREAFSVSELLAEVTAAAATRAPGRVAVRVRGLDDDLHIRGSRAHVTSILRELIDNAAKFTADGVEIRYGLAWDCTGDARRPRLHLAVADRGPGIPRSARERVMNAFERVETALDRAGEGIGIGLAIVARRLRASGGSWCFQEREEGGAVVHVDFPVELVDRADAQSEAPAARVVRRVLVVEDNPVNARVAVRLLEREGVEAAHVEDGAAALARLAEERFDLVLMDLQMPVMDGLAATRALRARGEDVEIVALTANATEKDRAACFDAGMDGFLEKPLRPGHLRAALGRPRGT